MFSLQQLLIVLKFVTPPMNAAIKKDGSPSFQCFRIIIYEEQTWSEALNTGSSDTN